MRSKSTALRLRTAGGNERSALKSSAVRCENRPQCGEIERSAHGKRPHCAPHSRSAQCALRAQRPHCAPIGAQCALAACCARRTARGRHEFPAAPRIATAAGPLAGLAPDERTVYGFIALPGAAERHRVHVLDRSGGRGRRRRPRCAAPRPKSLISQYVLSPSALSLWSAPLFRH